MKFTNSGSINDCFQWSYDPCIITGAQQPSAFTLSVGNSSDVNDHTQCASHNGAVAAGVTVYESCTATGRYLSFSVKGEAENPLTTLCEVVVIGHKYICTYPLFVHVGNSHQANKKHTVSMSTVIPLIKC